MLAVKDDLDDRAERGISVRKTDNTCTYSKLAYLQLFYCSSKVWCKTGFDRISYNKCKQIYHTTITWHTNSTNCTDSKFFQANVLLIVIRLITQWWLHALTYCPDSTRNNFSISPGTWGKSEEPKRKGKQERHNMWKTELLHLMLCQNTNYVLVKETLCTAQQRKWKRLKINYTCAADRPRFSEKVSRA